MKRLIPILISLFSAISTIPAQIVNNVTAHQNNDIVEIVYDLRQNADVYALLSFDGGRTYSKEQYSFYGDIGENIIAGKKKIEWRWKEDGFNHTLNNLCIKIVAENLLNNKRTFSINNVSFTMVKVEGGSFLMGATPEQGKDAEDNEKPKHSVTLSDYYIGETEVTQALWEAVMKMSVYNYMDMEEYTIPIKGIGKHYPMVYINLYDCKDFLAALNSYFANQLGGKVFSLPTEAQWEYAARGGNMSQSYIYSGSETIDDVAWHNKNAKDTSHQVGQKQPNELGIYDMSGNVWEWCQDWYGSYKKSKQTNPKGPTQGNEYVYRGGSFCNSYKSLRVSCRLKDAGTRHHHIGMRLVLQ